MRVGVDLGGTKISACVIAPDGSELSRERIATPQTGTADDIVTAIVDLVQQIERSFGECLPLGIGTPGSVSPRTGLIRNSNTSCLNDYALLHELQARLNRVVKIENDANCLALAEALVGAGKEYRKATVFAAIIGTGVGGGLVVNGQLLSGKHGLGGEWGHNPLPWYSGNGGDDVVCYCGKINCIETFLSGKGAAKRFEQMHGTHLSFEEILFQSTQDDSHHNYQAAKLFVENYKDHLAQAFASIINVYDPDVIIVAGGVSNSACLFDDVQTRWQEHVFCNEEVHTPFVPAQCGDDAGVIGAALLNPIP